MTDQEALDLIEKIAATGVRKEKEELLAELLATDIGRFIVKWTYDPFITFGLKSPAATSNTNSPVKFDLAHLGDLFDKLAQRQLTGNAAVDVLTTAMKVSTPAGAQLIHRIISKDLRCGVGSETVQRVDPALVPTFCVMRAHKFEEKRIKKWPVAVEPKMDGYRFTFLCRDGNGGFFTRSGKRADAAEHLVEPMIEQALKVMQTCDIRGDLAATLSTKPGHLGTYMRSSLNFMADGEMMMPGNFNETGALRRKSVQAEGAIFHVFDLLTFAEFDAIGTVPRPYSERRALVEEFVRDADPTKITKTTRYFCNSYQEIYDLYDRFRDRGLEGAMVKVMDAGYDKKKSHNWLKMKAEESEDLPIVGVFNGEVGKEWEFLLGGVIVERANGVHVRVGTGFSAEQRRELWELWKSDAALLGIDPQVGFKPGWSMPLSTKTELWAEFKLLNRLGEILFHEETPDGSLRHPRWKVFRDDKAGEVESKEAA